jgi:enolase
MNCFKAIHDSLYSAGVTIDMIPSIILIVITYFYVRATYHLLKESRKANDLAQRTFKLLNNPFVTINKLNGTVNDKQESFFEFMLCNTGNLIASNLRIELQMNDVDVFPSNYKLKAETGLILAPHGDEIKIQTNITKHGKELEDMIRISKTIFIRIELRYEGFNDNEQHYNFYYKKDAGEKELYQFIRYEKTKGKDE